MSGEASIGRTIFGQRPAGLPSIVSTQCITLQRPLAVASAAPQRPPTSAWLDDEGNPSHHVNRFQTIAPINAASTVAMVIASASTRPLPIVLATAVPHNAPMRLKNAAIKM